MIKAVVKKYLNLRTGKPQIDPDNNPSYYAPGDEIEILGTVIGEEYKGNNVWYNVNNGGFVIADGIAENNRLVNPLNSLFTQRINWSNSIPTLLPKCKTVYGLGVTIGVLDCGIEQSHSDIRDSVIGVNDFTDPNLKGIDDNIDGHGTHVVGIIAAKSNFANGIIGVAPNTKVAFAKVIGNGASKPGGEQIFEGLEWLNKSYHPHIYNISLGFDDTPSANLMQLLADFKNANKIVVAAAGDDEQLLPFDRFQRPRIIQFPANHNACLTVGAIRKDMTGQYENIKTRVDILCPNISYWSCSNSQNNLYKQLNGSSMSTAFISGVIALVISQKIKNGESINSVTKASLLEELRKMSTDISQFNYDDNSKFQFNVC